MPAKNSASESAPPPVSAEEQRATLAGEDSPAGPGSGRIAVAWPATKFTVGDIVVTQEGVELSAADADKVREAAAAANVQLVEMKEGEVK